MSLVRQFVGFGTWTRILIVFVFVWGVLVLMFATKLNTAEPDDTTIKRLNQVISYLEQSKRTHSELRLLIDEYLSIKSVRSEHRQKLIEDIENKLQFPANIKILNEPSLEYEKLRRRVRQNTEEMWNYVQSELKKLKSALSPSPDNKYVSQLDNILEMTAEHKRSLLNDMQQMQVEDGYELWRQQESIALSDLIQKRLNFLQNPEDCSTAPKLVCRLNKGCGYGCQLHHVVYCFIMAYGTERTLILKSKGWRYHKAGWEEVFKPLSQTCLTADGTSHSNWSGQQNAQVLDLPIIDSLNPRPPFLPSAIPEDIAPRLLRLHGDPIVWWVGQFLKYLLRMQPDTQNMVDDGRKKMGFIRPIVGVHVRRTDKVGTEASLHPIEEYMQSVDEYYEQLEMVEQIEKRRIFLASDDPKVIEEARTKYPNYEIIGDQEVARMAAVSTRYTDSSLNGIILDIHMLSLCDYLVCTFSSQVCRVAYEIMQTMYPDASDRFKSLDDIYYYGGQNAHNRQAVLPHHPRSPTEIFLNVGDLVGVAGNHWNGYTKGKNTRTNQVGLFPSFKVVDKVETADFPKYANIK